MLRTSLSILTWATLLALAAIAVFALRFSSADDTLDQAGRQFAKGESHRAVQLLDQIEADLRSDAVRTERLLRLRFAALQALGNDGAALRDADRLVRLAPGDATLRRARIELLSRTGDHAAALAAVNAWLGDAPDDAAAHELAGDVVARRSAPARATAEERMLRELPAADHGTARGLLRRWLNLPDGDPALDTTLAALTALHDGDPRLQASWQALAPTLPALRDDVQAATSAWRRSLEAGGPGTTAFAGLAQNLDRAGRRDDLLLASEIRRRAVATGPSATKVATVRDAAGAAAVWTLLRDGKDAHAVRTAARWLEPDLVARRLAAGPPTPALLDLLASAVWATHRAGDAASRSRVWQQVALLDGQRPTPLATQLGIVTNQPDWGDWRSVANSSRWTLASLPRGPHDDERVDLVTGVLRCWLQSLDVVAAGDAEVQECLRAWRERRPQALAPLLEAADRRQRAGQLQAAITTLADAVALAPRDGDVLDRYLAAQRLLVAGTDRDGDALLAQCLRHGRTRPETRDAAGTLFCGEAALARGVLSVAGACAAAAKDAFPLATAPRLLAARVHLASNRAGEATQEVDALLQRRPGDADAIELGLAAREAAAQDPGPFLAAVLPAATPTAALTAALIDHALADDPRRALAFVGPGADGPGASGVALLRLARAHAAAADVARAGALLDRALASGGGDDLELATTLAAFAEAAAATTSDRDLAPGLDDRLARIELHDGAAGAALLGAARDLAPTHPASAWALAAPGIGVADPARRTGADFVLAGELAARAGRWQQAEAHWTAALAFPDGAACIEDLACLCLGLGRPDRAEKVLALGAPPRDPALLVRFERYEDAAREVTALLQRDGADLLAHATLALVGPAFFVDWQPVTGSERQQRAELLALLRRPALAALARDGLVARAAAAPASRTTRLLLARAELARGDTIAAAALHAALDREGAADPTFYCEVALATSVPGYTCPPGLERKVMQAAVADGLARSPASTAFAAAATQRALRAEGRTAAADEIRRITWTTSPTAQPLTADDLAFVTTQLAPLAACTVLDQALAHGTVADRGAAADAFVVAAVAAAAAAPTALPQLVAAARRMLQQDGPRGAVVHFLLAASDQLGDSAVPAAERLALCRAHLAAVAAGRDDDRHLAATLARWQRLEDAPAAAAALAAALAAHPTNLALWRASLRLRSDGGDRAGAAHDGRGLLRFVGDPDLTLEVLALAGEADLLTAADDAAFAALPERARQGAAGRYVAGLLALRRGDADAAVADLTAAPARPDGIQLQLAALAWLQSSHTEGPARAHALLTALARDHASSSVARYAGSFASQLALP